MSRIYLSDRMKNVAKIFSGTMGGQIISIITLPIITRIFGASVIGGWTAINSIATILIYLCDLGISQAIMVEDDDEIEKTYKVVTTISLGICIVSFFFVFLYYYIGKHDVKLSCINSFFVVIYTFTFRQVQTCYIWLNREKEYSVLMKNPIINYGTAAFFSIILGLLGFKTYGYYIGTTLGQFVTLLHMKRKLPKKMISTDFAEMKFTINQNIEFVKFQMPAQIAAQTRQQLPNLLIGSLFGETMLGYFSISQKLISIPINLVGQSLGKVFYQTFAELYREGKDIASFVKRNMDRAMLVTFLPMVLFAAFGDAAIVFFFGREYAIGGTISRIVIYRACFTFLSTSLSGIDIVIRRQKYSMITCVAQTILASACVVFSYYLTNNILICTLLIVVSFIIIQIIYYIKIYSILKINPRIYCRNIVILLLSVFTCSCILRFLFIWFTNFTEWPFLLWLESFMVY